MLICTNLRICNRSDGCFWPLTIDQYRFMIVIGSITLSKKMTCRQSGRSPLPEASPKVGRSPSFKLEEHAAVESKPGGGGQLGGLRELGEQLVAEQQEEELEEDLLKPNGEDGR